MTKTEESGNRNVEVQTEEIKHVEDLSYEDAVIAYEEAIRLNPEDMTNYIELAQLHLDNGHEEEAVETAYKGIEVAKEIKTGTGEVVEKFPELARLLVDLLKDLNRMEELKEL